MKFILFVLCIVSSTHLLAQSTNVILNTIQDATLYESSDGSIANGSGANLFVGKTANKGSNSPSLKRRALIKFEITEEIPTSSIIDSVVLILNVTRENSGDHELTVHRISTDWGVGSSDASGQEGGGTQATDNDATWVHAFYPNVNWNNSGGDFDDEVLTSVVLSGVGTYTISDQNKLKNLVQAWVDGSQPNFGLLLKGDESTPKTAKRIGSAEFPGTSERPSLEVYYQVPTSVDILENIPQHFVLEANYPNPFNPSTQITYSVPVASRVDIKVFNQLGHRVQTLVNDVVQTAGTYTMAFTAQQTLASGIYYYKITATPLDNGSTFTQTRAMTFLK